MEYQTMSLVELKKVAKTRKIKQYYIKKRSELIDLLQLEVLPMKFKLEKMTIMELRTIAKDRGLRGFWVLPKEKLMDLLFPSPKDEKQNHSKTDDHEDPQEHHSD